jgi:hypothetical protein
VQVKEDGFSIDQIVLSAEQFLRVAPGALKNDTTLVLRDGSRCTMRLGTEPDAKSDEFDPSDLPNAREAGRVGRLGVRRLIGSSAPPSPISDAEILESDES